MKAPDTQKGTQEITTEWKNILLMSLMNHIKHDVDTGRLTTGETSAHNQGPTTKTENKRANNHQNNIDKNSGIEHLIIRVILGNRYWHPHYIHVITEAQRKQATQPVRVDHV